MNLAERKKKRAIVDKAFNIEAEEEAIDAAYAFNFEKESHISRTGLLKVFTLLPGDKNLPTFVGRWDHNKEELDIDIENTSRKTRVWFKSGKGGYAGHHTVRVSKDSRTYQVKICVPKGLIYQGLISFNINHSLELHDTIRVTATVDRVISRPGIMQRLLNFFKKRT